MNVRHCAIDFRHTFPLCTSRIDITSSIFQNVVQSNVARGLLYISEPPRSFRETAKKRDNIFMRGTDRNEFFCSSEDNLYPRAISKIDLHGRETFPRYPRKYLPSPLPPFPRAAVPLIVFFDVVSIRVFLLADLLATCAGWERYWTFRLRWAGLFLFHAIRSIEHDLWLQAWQYIFNMATRHSDRSPMSLLYSLPVPRLSPPPSAHVPGPCSVSALVKYGQFWSE